MSIDKFATVATMVATLIAGRNPWKSWLFYPTPDGFKLDGMGLDDSTAPPLGVMLSAELGAVDPMLRAGWMLSYSPGGKPSLTLLGTQVSGFAFDGWAALIADAGEASEWVNGSRMWSLTRNGIVIRFREIRVRAGAVA